ncbi:hypothetical protein ISCGN_030963 [Ixodes scapularis]
MHLPATMPFVSPSVQQEVFADASNTRLGLCLPTGNISILTHTPWGLFCRELWAVLCTLLVAPPRTLVRCDNQAVVRALTRGHGRSFSVLEALTATLLLCNKGSWISWISTDCNPADGPSRLNRTISRGSGRDRR